MQSIFFSPSFFNLVISISIVVLLYLILATIAESQASLERRAEEKRQRDLVNQQHDLKFNELLRQARNNQDKT